MTASKTYRRYFDPHTSLNLFLFLTIFLINFSGTNHTTLVLGTKNFYIICAYFAFSIVSMYYSRTVIKTNNEGIEVSKIPPSSIRRKTIKVKWSDIKAITSDEISLSFFMDNLKKSQLTIDDKDTYQLHDLVNQINKHIGNRFPDWHDNLVLLPIQKENKLFKRTAVLNYLTLAVALLYPIINSQLEYVFVTPYETYNVGWYLFFLILALSIICLTVFPILSIILYDINAEKFATLRKNLNIFRHDVVASRTRHLKLIHFIVLPMLITLCVLDGIELYNEYLIKHNQLTAIPITAKGTSLDEDRQYWHIIEKQNVPTDIKLSLTNWRGINTQLVEDTPYQMTAYQGRFGYLLMTPEQFAEAKPIKAKNHY